MRVHIQRQLIFSVLVFFFYAGVDAHGFCYHTGVQADSGRCFALGSIKKGCKWVASYNFDLHTADFAPVQAAGVSKTNCYFRITLRKEVADVCKNEILCTPTQLFYMPSTHMWVPAIDLHVGDELLGIYGTSEPIAYIEFVNKPLEVYTIEVKKNHNFFVGCRHHAVLVHNMLAPVSLWAGLSIAFGEGAAVGGSACSFLGPVTIVGGIVIGGLVGVAAHSLWQSRFTYTLAFNAPGICEYRVIKQRNTDATLVYNIGYSRMNTPSECDEISKFYAREQTANLLIALQNIQQDDTRYDNSLKAPTLHPNDPDDEDKEKNPRKGLTNKEARAKAREWGFKEDKSPPFNSHGKPAFKKGRRWITPDRDGHNGGIWKEFEGKYRIGTLDAHGNRLKA